jgi:hypothetical protein
MINEIEYLIVAKIASLTESSVNLFRTSQAWNHQITAAGLNSFERLSPFALVKFLPANVGRAGDYDLSRSLDFGVTIGVHGPDARSECLDLADAVIDAIDKKHPLELHVGEDPAPSGVTCDRLLLDEMVEIVDAQNQYAISLVFQVKLTE